MPDFDLKLMVYGAWATGCLVVWGKAFSDAFGDYKLVRRGIRRERRAQSALKELLSDAAMLLVAIASAVAIVTLVIGQDVPGVRGFTLAMVLGGILGAGVVKVTFRSRKR